VLFLEFRDTSGLTNNTKAMAVLWLRDLIDNDKDLVEVALFQADDDKGYVLLQRNYVPPRGGLQAWSDRSRAKVKRVGSVWVNITFMAGIGDAHRKMFKGSADPKKKGAWDEVQRAEAGGMREEVGQPGEAVEEITRRAEESKKSNGDSHDSDVGGERHAQEASDETARQPDSQGGIQRRNATRVPGGSESNSPTRTNTSSALDSLMSTRAVENLRRAARLSTYTSGSGSTADTETSTRAVENALQRGGTSSTAGSSVRAVENGGGTNRLRGRVDTVGTVKTDLTDSTADTGTSNRAVENARHGAGEERRGSSLQVVEDGDTVYQTAPSVFGGTQGTGSSHYAAESGGVSRVPTAFSGRTGMTDTSTRAVENGGGVSRVPTAFSGRTEHTDTSTRAIENGGHSDVYPGAADGRMARADAPVTTANEGEITRRPVITSPVMSGDTITSTDAVENDDASEDTFAPRGTDYTQADSSSREEGSTTAGHHNDGIDGAGADGYASSSSGSSGTEGDHRGLLQKVKDWKSHQRELAHEHRGVMQAKPMRTAEWIKDNVEEGAHALKGRLKHKERQPQVETEA
jgi:hypothetical protein